MTVLSVSQAVTLCLRYSASPHNIGRAVGVMWLESGLNTSARCYNYRNSSGRVVCSNTPIAGQLSVDRGIWQINSKAHPTVTDAMADDPATATTYAFHLSSGFTDWGAWSSRSYLPGGSNANTQRGQAAARIITSAEAEAKAQLANDKGPSPITAATAAVGGTLYGAGGAVASGVGGLVHAVTSLPEFLGKLSDPRTWTRVVLVVGGSVSVVAGAVILGKNTVTAPLGDAANLTAHAAAAAL